METKGTNKLRIYSQNIQGISTQNPADDFHFMLAAMTDQQADIFGWSETNIEWNDYILNAKLFPIYKQHFPRGKWLPSTSNIPLETTYKPGGNLLGLHKNVTARTHETYRDPLGRWSWAQVAGRKIPLTVIQLYVPGSTIATGLKTSYVQQYE